MWWTRTGESVIVSFAATIRPTKIEAWPLIYGVEPLSPRPLQCGKCWRHEHTTKGCRYVYSCRVCGEDQNSSGCKSKEEKCCLCNEAHCADYSNGSAKAREMQILDIFKRRRCSPRKAIAEIQARSWGYAGVTARQTARQRRRLFHFLLPMFSKRQQKRPWTLL